MNLTTPIEPIIPFTIDSCRTLCENATFQTNYSFMILITLGILSITIARICNHQKLDFKYFTEKTFNELGYALLILGAIYFLYLSSTGGLL